MKIKVDGRKYRRERRELRTILLVIAVAIIAYNIGSPNKPVEKAEAVIAPTPTPTSTPTPTPTPVRFYREGLASWYGTGADECLGCSPNRTMANGERLDDNKKTVACGVGGSCKYFPVGSTVEIMNLDNNMITTAKVKDTGGFAKYHRILDMSKKVKNLLNCKGICRVRVYAK